MFKTSDGANHNYLCQIVKVGKTNPVPNSDNLLITNVQGNIVVINKSIKEGDIVVYFPVECQIQDWYLVQNNLYTERKRNSDSTKKGFINNNGRVRCVELRKQPSQGLLMPISSLGIGLDSDIDEDIIGMEFDTFMGQLLVKKYVVKAKKEHKSSLKPVKKAKQKPFSKVIEGQFNFHISTPQLGKFIHEIKPSDTISITKKLHGTSGVSSYVLCGEPVYKVQKISCWIDNNIISPFLYLFSGVSVRTTPKDRDYSYLYSSRRVIKNDIIKADGGFYETDIWGHAHEVLKPALKKGMTMYYEIVGFTNTGGFIQNNYDYGCVPPEYGDVYTEGKHFKVFVYRITMTNPDGFVTEYTAKQVQEYCMQNMIKAVPEVFYGSAINYTPIDANGIMSNTWNDDRDNDVWRQQFIDGLRAEHLEKDCDLCNNDVPAEGVVIRKEGLGLSVFKFKSFRFLKIETEELDKGVVNIEDDELTFNN